MDNKKILEIINSIQLRAETDYKKFNAIAPNSYGVGVEFGIIDCCKMLKHKIIK